MLLVFEIVIAIGLGFGQADLTKHVLRSYRFDSGPQDMRTVSSTLPADLAKAPWPKSSNGIDFLFWGLLHGIVFFGLVHFVSRKTMKLKTQPIEKTAMLTTVLFLVMLVCAMIMRRFYDQLEIIFVVAFVAQSIYFWQRLNDELPEWDWKGVMIGIFLFELPVISGTVILFRVYNF